MKFRRPRQRSNFRAQAVEKLKPLQARRVEIIMDVMRQVDANELDRKAEARRPLLRDRFKIFRRQPMIPRLLEDLRDRRRISSGKRLLANGPEGEDEWLSRARHPLFRQVESVVARAVDL